MSRIVGEFNYNDGDLELTKYEDGALLVADRGGAIYVPAGAIPALQALLITRTPVEREPPNAGKSVVVGDIFAETFFSARRENLQRIRETVTRAEKAPRSAFEELVAYAGAAS